MDEDFRSLLMDPALNPNIANIWTSANRLFSMSPIPVGIAVYRRLNKITKINKSESRHGSRPIEPNPKEADIIILRSKLFTRLRSVDRPFWLLQSQTQTKSKSFEFIDETLFINFPKPRTGKYGSVQQRSTRHKMVAVLPSSRLLL